MRLMRPLSTSMHTPSLRVSKGHLPEGVGGVGFGVGGVGFGLGGLGVGPGQTPQPLTRAKKRRLRARRRAADAEVLDAMVW